MTTSLTLRATKGAALTHSEMDANLTALKTTADAAVERAGDTLTGKLNLLASTTVTAGINFGAGTAPTTPVNGDAWATTTGLFVRVNGTTRQFATLDGAETLTNKTLDGGVSVSDTGTIAANSPGFRGRPSLQKTGAYTLILTDQGKRIYATAGSFAVTIPPNADVAFPIGTEIEVIAADASKTIVAGSGVTIYLAGTGTTGTRTVAAQGVAMLYKVDTNLWFVGGNGVT